MRPLIATTTLLLVCGAMSVRAQQPSRPAGPEDAVQRTIEALFRAVELKEFTDFRYRPADIEVELHGSLAWAIFRYTLQAKMGERTLDMVGRGTAVLEQRGDRWVIRHTHTSNRARRPSDPTGTPQ